MPAPERGNEIESLLARADAVAARYDAAIRALRDAEKLTKAEKRRCIRCGFAFWQHSDTSYLCPFQDIETFEIERAKDRTR